jgi:hypothetical protein
MPRNNFGEFMEFFLKGLNTFKVQASLKFDLLPKFLIQNPEGFGGRAKRESCNHGMAYFIFLKYFNSLEDFRKNLHVKFLPKSPCAIFQSSAKF